MDPRMLVNSNIDAPAPNYPNRSFYLEKLIGYGAEGYVYLAKVTKWNNRVNDRVALKLQPKIKQDEINFMFSLIQIQTKCEQTSNPKLLSLLEQASSNIIRVYEIIKWNNYNFVLMEAGAQNLNSFIQSEKNLQIQSKLEIMKQIAQSILFLHKNGIIHRDIKPENFILVGQQFKLIDFGLVRQNSQLIKTAHVGTPLFASPEIFEESIHYTESVDIWSLACVFYELIQSSPLIPGNTIQDVKKIVLNHKYQPEAIYNKIESTQISSSLKSLLKRMINPSPEKRCSIEEVLDQLQNIMITDYQLGQCRDNPRLNEGNNPQQQQFINQSPFKQNKTDQNFYVFQNQTNQQQASIQKNGTFPINNQQIEMQNFLKGGITQIQQILGNQIQQAQDQNRELIEQTINLAQQNKTLLELTEKNQIQIEYLQKKLIEKEKDDQKEKTPNISNRSQCNCDAENKKLLRELQKQIEKENQSNLEQISSMNKALTYFQQSIIQISAHLEQIKIQHKEEPANSKNSQQQSTSALNHIISLIQSSEKNTQQSISQLKSNIQSQYQQILNKYIEKNEFDEFNATQKNSKDNDQKMIEQIYKLNQQLNKNLLAEIMSKFENYLQESAGIIQNLKYEILKNTKPIAEKIESFTGQSHQQNTQTYQQQMTAQRNAHHSQPNQTPQEYKQNQTIKQSNQQEGLNQRSNKQERPRYQQ